MLSTVKEESEDVGMIDSICAAFAIHIVDT